MVSALPGPQPIDFNTPPLLLCDCDSIPPTLIDIDDVLVFQFRKEACADDAVIFDGPVGAVVDGMGWTYLVDGALRVTPGLGTINGTFPFVPAPGATYRIVVGDLILSGGHFTISCGGHSFDIGTPGFSTIIFTAITAAPLVLTSFNDSKFILSGLVITDFAAALQVAITDTEGGVTTINYSSNHSLFSFSGDRVTAMIPMSDTHINAEQCFTVTVTDGCDGGSGSGSGSGSDGELVSQRLRAIRPDCRTLTVRTCLDEDAMGFAPFAPRVLVPAQLGRPTWKHDVAEQRGVDGRHMTTYADRVTSLALRIGALGYHDHNYLSSLPEWDHVYLYSQGTIVEVQPDGEAYEPAYADNDSVASVEIEFRLKEELVRNVNCGAEGDGCNPASDPICNTADVSFTFNLDGSAINITLNGITSFVPGDVTVTVGSGTPTVHTFDTETLPDTITIGHLPNDTYDIVVHIADASRAECFDERILHHLFRCAGEGFGTYGVPAGGTGILEIITSTGWFSTRNMATDEVVVYGDFNTSGDSTAILAGDYCVYASDEAGVQSGAITIYDTSDSDTTYYTIMDYTSLTIYGAFNLPHLVALPQAPDSVVAENYGNLPLVTALPSPPASSMASNYYSLNQVTEIPAQHAGIEYFNMTDMPLVTTLPDFATGAQVRLVLNNCPLLHTIGVLPQITNLVITDCGFNTSSVVDALVNALNPSAPPGGAYKHAAFNGLLSLRTSASDANYNDCLANGWTFS